MTQPPNHLYLAEIKMLDSVKIYYICIQDNSQRF
nr:MAG TPA: hypothetical protein [Caudoviricetes sp.]DAZ42635.1 MAG TPA: hypothetical protein [Caudoviricetes sp.]